jgi:uncharacterized protein YrrD
MRRGREIVGLPVIKLSTGKELGLVTDLFWNHDQRKIKAISLDTGRVVSRVEPISVGDIAYLGQDAVTVPDEATTVVNADRDSDRSIGAVAGVMVVTDTGRNLGTLQDLVFDDFGELLVGYEVSGGLVGDFISGREVLPPDAVLAWGTEAVVVKDLNLNRNSANACGGRGGTSSPTLEGLGNNQGKEAAE